VSAPVVREHDILDVAVTIRNTGQRYGKEVVQLYLHERAPIYPRPPKELKAFQKVALAPGEEKRIHFQLATRDFAQYDPHARAWIANSGTFDIMIGASSRDIRLSQSVEFAATAPRLRRLDRYSPIRAWLAHPAGRAFLAEPLAALQRAIGVTAEQQTSPMLEAFFLDLPVGKLVLLGAITDTALEQMLREVNADAARSN
jgi:beta-glucosidase